MLSLSTDTIGQTTLITKSSNQKIVLGDEHMSTMRITLLRLNLYNSEPELDRLIMTSITKVIEN